MLNFGPSPIIGLDIGTDTVKAVQLRKNGQGYIAEAAAIAHISPADNHEKRKLHTTAAIKNCLAAANINNPKQSLFVCSIAGAEVKVSSFNFPKMPDEDLEYAVTLEAEQVCPIDIRKSVIDYHLIEKTPPDEASTSGVLVAATRKAIKDKMTIAQNASVKCAMIDVDGLAILNCYTESQTQTPNKTAVFVNIGKALTTVAILGADSMPFIRDLSWAADNIIEVIAEKQSMSIVAAENILKSPEKLPADFHDSLALAAHRLVMDISETLRYFTISKTAQHIDEIFITGGMALSKELIEILDKHIDAKVTAFNPFDNIKRDTNIPGAEILQAKGPALAVAAGLAMRSI